LFVTSEVPVFKVFSDKATRGDKGISDHMSSVTDDLVSPLIHLPFKHVTYIVYVGSSTDIVRSSSMFTGEEEVFAFARVCSKLVQMGSKRLLGSNDI
ncbi:hypothetical protein P691DRAFT_688674, partial [Macrolepiota fuliginosa MF-IS2]